MKFLILLFGVAIVIELHKSTIIGKCDTDVKSYDIDVEFVRPTKNSPNIFNYGNIKVVRHNRTTNVVSGTIAYSMALDNSIYVNLRSYQKTGDEFQEAFLKFENQSLCSVIDTDTFIYPSLVEASDLPAKCPIPAKTYTINNWIFDMKRLPSYIPGSYWLLVANTTQGDKLLSQLEIGARVEHKTAF